MQEMEGEGGSKANQFGISAPESPVLFCQLCLNLSCNAVKACSYSSSITPRKIAPLFWIHDLIKAAEFQQQRL